LAREDGCELADGTATIRLSRKAVYYPGKRGVLSDYCLVQVGQCWKNLNHRGSEKFENKSLASLCVSVVNGFLFHYLEI
jgi:hypothetical protein